MFVVIGNPPYNIGQVNENDNNKNRKYPTMDEAGRGDVRERHQRQEIRMQTVRSLRKGNSLGIRSD